MRLFCAFVWRLSRVGTRWNNELCVMRFRFVIFEFQFSNHKTNILLDLLQK